MPAIANSSTSFRAKHFTPPDPNLTHDYSAHQPSIDPIPKPSAKVVETKSHISEEENERHYLKRRFLGSIPLKIINSNETIEKRKRIYDLRKRALSHLPIIRNLENDDDDGSDNQGNNNNSSTSFIDNGVRGGNNNKHQNLIREATKKIKILKKGKKGEDIIEQLDLHFESPNLSENYDSHQKQKATDKEKNIWIGDSFDIGREFIGIIIDENEEVHKQENDTISSIQTFPETAKEKDKESMKSKSKSIKTRPTVSTRTTQESFVTARTKFSTSTSIYQQGESSRSTLDLDISPEGDDNGNDLAGNLGGYELTPKPSLGEDDEGEEEEEEEETIKKGLRNSQSSSIQPLVSDSTYGEDHSHLPSLRNSALQNQSDDIGQLDVIEGTKIRNKKSSGSISTRLKSALRKSSKPENELTSTQSAIHPNEQTTTSSPKKDLKKGKSKSVQFPIDPIQDPSSKKSTLKGIKEDQNESLKGDKSPVHPLKVLERSGDDVIGTSQQAVEEALEEQEEEEEDDWEEVKRPGEIILRDRMIVRVGYHREDKLVGFDENSQRRNPCSRLDPLEEYIGIYRKGQIELYSNYNYPFQEKLIGHKHLAFIIPLLGTRTNSSIFNSEDVTICLTTSINKLQDDVNVLLRSNNTRAGKMKSKIKQSKQIQWLNKFNINKRGGSQIFIMKLAERSRSLDWFWEIFRELNGELPFKFDISIPDLSTSIRLFVNNNNDNNNNNDGISKIQDDDNEIGNSKQCAKFQKDKVIKDCYEMLLNTSINIEELKKQSEIGSSTRLNLQLAWKNNFGNLDWIVYDNTVQGEKRDWNLLSGLARSQGERKPRELQLRPAKHQPSLLKLQDGTLLEEPPGIEGYLMRHKDGAVKEQVYISSHDGNIFVGNMKDAQPPLLPSRESSTPSELFPDLYKTFIDNEHERISRFLKNCSGCIDLRDIQSIEIIPDKTTSKGKSRSRSNTTSSQMQGFNRIITDSTIDHQPDPNQTDFTHNHGQRETNTEIKGKTFEVIVNTGGNVRLEAQSTDIAEEWVERLRELQKYWERRHRVDARQRMDAITLHSHENPFTGTELSNDSDNFISEIWDWCVIKGCRSICISGKLFMKKDKWDKFRSKYIVLTGGALISFKIQKKNAFHIRKKRYSLYGAYVYSGMLALDELPSTSSSDTFTSQSRVYQDGLQSSDGAEDTTFCIRLSSKKFNKHSINHPWGILENDLSNKNNYNDIESNNKEEQSKSQTGNQNKVVDSMTSIPIPDLSKKANQLLIFRARSKLERDRWVWAINAEMERQVRTHIKQEDMLRNHGNVPDDW
ncbi:uncharacterized protein L201_003632 [Kwoniella dendrophila CBS 6074]|uniref:PH domain-containing protein n=1 Tax=Kwoniella dendrophila CBS 6074 TaxID=1295534 RepID=A0AAX4JV82_9TREE